MALELRDLDTDERVALVALVELMARANAQVTDEEVDCVGRVVAALGEDGYRAAVVEADRRFENEDDLRAFLPSVTRQEARELIYETVLGEAMSDAVDAREGELLDWLAGQWSIATRIEDGGEA